MNPESPKRATHWIFANQLLMENGKTLGQMLREQGWQGQEPQLPFGRVSVEEFEKSRER